MVGTPRVVAAISLGLFRLSRKEIAMNGVVITDAELKDILLTFAKSGAPKPKDGTVLGDALVRFTTPSESDKLKDGPPDRINRVGRNRPTPPAPQPPIEGEPEMPF
jgi:hypothetical protein